MTAQMWDRFLDTRTVAVLAIALAADAASILTSDHWRSISVAIALGLAAYFSIRYVVGLRADVDELRTEVRDLQAKFDQAIQDAEERHMSGIEEGKRQWIGMNQALQAGDPPRLIERRKWQGELILRAKSEEEEPPPRGTRYEVRWGVSQMKQGVVEVTDVTPISGYVDMKCVENLVPEFWQKFADDATTQPAIPDGIELAPAEYEWPSGLVDSDK